MSNYPTITYGHAVGFTDDMDVFDAAVWVPEGAPTLTATLAVDSGDYFKITTTGGAGSKYWEKTPTDSVLVGPTATYKKWKVRCKTEGTIQFRVAATLSVSGDVDLVPAGSSTTFKVYEGDFPVDEGLSKLRIYIVGTHAANRHVYYDFTLVCQNEFTFPNANVHFFEPESRDAVLKPPGRSGHILQDLGSEMAQIHVTADLDQGSWGTPVAAVIDQISHEQSADLWQWFTLQLGRKFKARFMGKPEISSVDAKKSLDLWLTEYKLAPTSAEISAERFGHV